MKHSLKQRGALSSRSWSATGRSSNVAFGNIETKKNPLSKRLQSRQMPDLMIVDGCNVSRPGFRRNRVIIQHGPPPVFNTDHRPSANPCSRAQRSKARVAYNVDVSAPDSLNRFVLARSRGFAVRAIQRKTRYSPRRRELFTRRNLL